MMLAMAVAASTISVPVARLEACDVVWATPSADSAGSMPIGNGEVVLNAWVEESTGDLLFLIARTDSLSEISRYLKLGRIRIHLAGNPLSGHEFRQHLRLRDGVIDISGKDARLTLFVDSEADVIHVVGRSRTPLAVVASVECWRNAPRTLPKAEQGSAWSVHDAPFPLIESADLFAQGLRGSVRWWHRNESSVVPQLWANQSLAGLAGRFDPILHRTFGGLLTARAGGESQTPFVAEGRSLRSAAPVDSFDIAVATACGQTATADAWSRMVGAELRKSPPEAALGRTKAWWHAFWDRSWVFAEGDFRGEPIPANSHPLRRGIDSNGGNEFPGTIEHWLWTADDGPARDSQPVDLEVSKTLRLSATVTLRELKPGRIFDKVTAGREDGFLFDTYPGDGLRLQVGKTTLIAGHCLEAGKTYSTWATYDATSGEAAIYLYGKRIAHRAPETGSPVTRGYTLQRYVQACQGRGAYPIKFNGGFYSVEPAPMDEAYDADWRRWGDSHWWQNVRHMYEPMLAQGDADMTEPLFRLYESARPLAEARARSYHGASGAYFPETMTVFGTYSGGDYGWDRTGHQPKDVLCPWWQYAWNQGPELVALMLDRWDWTRDEAFLRKRALPMAESVLRYFDTRFRKENGKIVLDPTQAVETYWQGVVNDMPTTAGLRAITARLCALPLRVVSKTQRAFFERMRAACPDLPVGGGVLKPAQQYDPKTNNVENPELYAVWPFRVVSLSNPALLAEAKAAYAKRLNHLDTGWGYDGNVAALLGMADEAARILRVKCANSHPRYRWPATWGPNFDWLPDQNHGGNLLETANLMLLQSDPLEQGGAIRVLPAWPTAWDVDFKLRAAGNTVVRCRTNGNRIVELRVEPESRRKDVVIGDGFELAFK